MSLTDSPDCFSRPEDKAMKMLFGLADDQTHNSFDEFFNIEVFERSSDKEPTPLEDFFVEGQVEDFGSAHFPSSQLEHSVQPWRKGLWCMNAAPNSELVISKTRKLSRLGQKFVSPTHLVNKDGFALAEPVPMAGPKTKTRLASPETDCFDRTYHTRRTAIRDQTLSPSPAYAKLPTGGKMGDSESWQRDFKNFHLQMPDNGTYLSPQRSQASARNEMALRQANERVVAHNATVSQHSQSPTRYHYPFGHDSSPVKAGPCAEYQASYSADDDLHNTTSQIPYNIHTFTNLDQSNVMVWANDNMHSSDSSQHSCGSQQSSDAYQTSHTAFLAQPWASPPPAARARHPENYNGTRLVAPVPQRVPRQLMYEQLDMVDGGLLVHYIAPEAIGTALPYGPMPVQDHRYATATPPPASTSSIPYPPLPPYPSDIFPEASPFTTPRKHEFLPSRSPSPLTSPTRRATSQGRGQRSPSRNNGNHNRRKSLHKAGPIKENTVQDDGRQTRSSSRPPRTPRTPKTPNIAGFQLDFVNYTSRDSTKLMNDVAPSGSSKTRARREQEAREKRKKLSEAAMQAVRRAGGDVKALEEAIFV